MTAAPDRLRLDKWLWSARIYKTRSLAVEEIDKGRVSVNGQPAKPARELRPGDRIEIRQAGLQRELVVLGLSLVRGPAPVAQALYRETDDSLARRAAAQDARRLGVEPAAGREDGRPTKRDRRQLAEWDRWSAQADDAGGDAS